MSHAHPEPYPVFEDPIVQKAIFTIVSNNYLHYARTLLQSVAIHHPECRRYCVIVDRDTTHAERFPDEFEVIRLADLGLPEPAKFLFRYTILELNTAVKPWAIARLFAKGHRDVAYIDPDIRLYRPMREVFDLLGTEADVVLTPHLLAPVDDEREPSELTIRRAGTYNLGFCALARTANASALLAWWQNKLVRDCVVDLARGIFVDQSWIDLVPGLFPRVAVLRHAGYNVAYWNLAQRAVAVDGGRWTAGGEPLVFFHFSGFNAEQPAPFSKHQDRFTLDNLGAVKPLALDYAAALIANGARTLKTLPYGYGVFSDGVTRVSDLFRRLYREDVALQEAMGEDPFDHPAMLTTLMDDQRSNALGITYALFAVWSARADLRDAFPLSDAESVGRYYEWFAGEGEHYFSPNVVDAHATLYERLRSAPAVATHGVQSIARTRFVQQMYFAVLGREADAEGLDIYETASTKRLGSLRVYLALLLSMESRRRPAWRVRAERAARIMLAHALDVSAPATKVPTPTVDARPGRVQGWWTADADTAEHGCWVAPSASFPCRVVEGGTIEIDGVAFGTYTHRHDGAAARELTISIDDRFVATRALDFDGPFTICEPIPATCATGPSMLRLESPAYFVPRDIAAGADGRTLAWRALRVTVGDERLVDHARVPPLLPLDEIVGVGGVNVVGYIAAESGVGESARSFAKGCLAAGLACHAIDVGYQNRNRQEDRSFAATAPDARRFRFNVLHVNADQTPTTLEAMRRDPRAGDVNVGYWHWEQAALPVRFLPSFEGLDEVWVPSAFVHEAVAAISPIPVFKVPHVVEFAIPAPGLRTKFGLPADLFLALAMYDVDSYQTRKNPQAAIDAYRRVAATHPHAGLVIKTINGDRDPDARRALLDAIAGLPNVFCIDAYLSRAEIYELERACDCFISLHRAEGFGLALAEMMYLGKPVIATGWSGNMEFMNAMNSMPVDYALRPLPSDLGVYEAGQPWAEADVDHAADALRRLVDDRALRERIGARAAADMRAGYSAAAIGRACSQRLALLALRRL